MWNKNVVDFMGCDVAYEEADIVLFGVPFDSTTSFRPGTRFAGQAIRNDSYGLETYSPYQDRDLTEKRIFDCGDLELSIGNAQMVLEQIEACAKQILTDGKLPFMIGGEHLVTLGSVRAVARKYPDMHIIHFDAHTDLRQDYLGVELSLSLIHIFATPSRKENLSSYKSIRGITKKVAMWLLVVVGVIIDELIKYSITAIGLSVPFTFLIACIVAIWLICNELISILENIADIGIKLPAFLQKIVYYIKEQAEMKVDIDDFEEKDEGEDV